MKILYGIQGTGNGHVSRAREIIPHLQRFGVVDILLSGTQSEVNPGFEVTYRFHGFGFRFGQKGNVDFTGTISDFHFREFAKDVKNLPVHNYDVIIHDFEPVTAWACRLKNIPCAEMSHQVSLSSPQTPKLKGFHWGKIILDNYSPKTFRTGFHFQKYDDFIHTPVIRSEVRAMQPIQNDFYVVYLPSFGDGLIEKLLLQFPKENFTVFSKHAQQPHQTRNILFLKIENQAYLHHLAKCKGLITGAGFEGPSEALFLQKKLICIPMCNQFEQLCNAKALEEMNVSVVWKIRDLKTKLDSFFQSDEITEVCFPDETAEIVKNVIQKFQN